MEKIRCACGKEFFFGRTEDGKRIPLDASAPCYILLDEKEGTVVRAHTAFVNHFVTCPKANEFNRKKKEAGDGPVRSGDGGPDRPKQDGD